MKRLGWIVALATAAIIGVACSGSEGAGAVSTSSGVATATDLGAVQQIALQAMDTMRFDPSSIAVRAGEPIQLTLINSGQVVHDFTLTDGVAQPVHIEAQPDQTATGTFTITQPGTYAFICAQPGHDAAGMHGTLLVQ